MAEYIKGNFCTATQGHDKGTTYIIVETEKAIYVADGKIRKLDNPKRKNPKHLMILSYRDELLEKKIAENKLHDEDIKYSIKNYLIYTNSLQEVSECQNQM